ncbi:E3 ubiquitin-protein ligase TRIM39-like [Chanos chanos]|uniref:E3 ubiquitin-protein ligase TRIM39-like n=1 Tax=Chanos chanos TaxID=29144 RepID=A0A6J2VL96_CHACN|nr:E3 ubiquitin-protein ligase TRIM39-like [Chanos chanos]
MASSSSLLSEDQFLCSVCLDVFTDPVSTPCGHNFCMTCLKEFWDSTQHCHCPLCKRQFRTRPQLSINTTFREIVDQFKKRGDPVKPGEVSCDVCTSGKLKAVKSCLDCGLTYCQTHLEPHKIAAKLKKHKLINPVENLEDYICQKHDRPLELFCRDDQTCVCQFCTETDHRTHSTVPLEEESEERKSQLRRTHTEVQQMIQDKLKKIKEIRHSVQLSNKSTQTDVADSVEVLTTLVQFTEKGLAELIELMEQKQRAAERQAEGLIKELEQEITELKRRDAELEQLSHSEDHLHLLQVHPRLLHPPVTKHSRDVSINSCLCVSTLRKVLTQLLESTEAQLQKLAETELKKMKQYAVNVTLDPDTAHPELILSDDGKQVRHGDTEQNLPDNPERFDSFIFVLGKEGFSSGRFYYEVGVREKTEWDIGVARGSINRKGEITLSPEDGYWSICLRNGDEYWACESPPVSLSLRQKPQKVGVFVDYEEGLVSFYDVKARAHIYSFTGHSFTEKLYPFLSPSLNEDGTNSASLVVSPVKYIKKLPRFSLPAFYFPRGEI